MQVTQQTAIHGKSRNDVSSRHITTFAINDIRPTFILPVKQGDKVVVDINQAHQFSPLVCPTYGAFKIKTYAFFVPLTSIWHHFYEYLDGSSDGSFDGVKEPLNVSIYDLVSYFFSTFATTAKSDLLTAIANPDANGRYDLTTAYFATDSTTTPTEKKWNFTAKGRLLWNFMQALGYGLPTYICHGASGTKYEIYLEAKEHSLFPLLACARVFYDYLYPSAYVTQRGFGYLFTDALWETLNGGSQSAVSGVIDSIMALFINCYDRDFYTSLWAKPNQVASTGNLGSFPLVSQVRSGSNLVSLNAGSQSSSSSEPTAPLDAFVSQGSNSQVTSFSATMLRWLQSISDFCMRNNIGGSRVREYLRSNYGFVPNDAKNGISQYLKCFSANVDIKPVTSLSSGFDSSQALGEKAGQAFAAGQGTLKFESSEWGILLFMTSVVPSIGYVQGVNPLARAINSRFDFYNEQFDGVAMEAVPRKSLFSQYRSLNDVTKVPVESRNDVFGYCPYSAEKYKIGHDILSGDFIFNSRSRGLESYHTFRDVLYGRSNLALDAQFIATDNQTQRIFANTGSNDSDAGDRYALFDKIFSFMRFDATNYSNMKPLSQSLPMFDHSGKKQSVQYEGNQL